MARKNKLYFTVNQLEKNMIIKAAKASDQSVATFIRDASINKAQKTKVKK